MILTIKEKEENSVTKHKLVVFGATNNFTIAEVRLMFDIYKISYSLKSMRTTYYRAKEGRFKNSSIPKHLVENVRKMFDTMLFVKLCIDSLPKEPKRAYKIEGDYLSSINNVRNL